MNKKVLGIALTLLFAFVLATPVIGTVMAGKGQEKLDFLLHMVGRTFPPPDKMWEAGVTIYTDDTKTTERGTIEILTQGENPGGKGLMVNGYGTGEFEGIKITGLTATESIPNPNPPPTNLLNIDRAGIVMGWPT